MDGILGRFLSFDKMIAGSVIKVVYYIMLVILIGGALVTMVQALLGGNFVRFLLTPIGLIVGILILRILSEMYIVIFRISDNLAALKKLKEEGK